MRHLILLLRCSAALLIVEIDAARYTNVADLIAQIAGIALIPGVLI